MNDFERIFPYVFPFFFVGMWLLVTTILRSVSGMTRELAVSVGSALRESRWGSMTVNGVAARNCAKIEEHPDGYVVRMQWIFGGGRLWLSKADLRIGDAQPKRFLYPRSRTMISGLNQVVLFDELSDFVAPDVRRH